MTIILISSTTRTLFTLNSRSINSCYNTNIFCNCAAAYTTTTRNSISHHHHHHNNNNNRISARRDSDSQRSSIPSVVNTNVKQRLERFVTSTVARKHSTQLFVSQHLYPPNTTTTTGCNSSAFTTMTSPESMNRHNNQDTAEVYTTEMTDSERYLFDLNGYIIIKNVLTSDEVQAANQAIDRHSDTIMERDATVLRNAIPGSLMYGSGPGRKDLGRVLEWGIHDSTVFASILNHPRLVPVFHGLLGKGYRMDHLPFCILQDYGSEGFQLHGGTIDCVSGEYNPHLAYTCHHNMIRTALLGCSVVLTDHNPGDGGFCVVPGSHKANFQMPPGMVDGSDEYKEYIHQPVTKAGDVVLFSEGTVHGALPWTPQNRQRRICLYRFAPATNAYGRSYFGSHCLDVDVDGNKQGEDRIMGWPRAMYEGLSEGQRAVLEPPYANRIDRPNIQEEDGSVIITTRNERKKQHDRDVFGTKYF